MIHYTAKTADGKLQVNQGMFDNKGNYITPAGDIGHFDETGKFIPYEMNPYEGGYYDQHGQFHEFGDAYIDQFGYVRVTGEDEYIDKHGNVIKVGSEMGIKDEKGNIVLADGTVITPEGKVGYYNEKGKLYKEPTHIQKVIMIPAVILLCQMEQLLRLKEK